MPSMDKNPSGRLPKRSRAACRGHRPGVREGTCTRGGVGYGGGGDQEDASRENGRTRTETALATQGGPGPRPCGGACERAGATRGTSATWTRTGPSRGPGGSGARSARWRRGAWRGAPRAGPSAGPGESRLRRLLSGASYPGQWVRSIVIRVGWPQSIRPGPGARSGVTECTASHWGNAPWRVVVGREGRATVG